MEDNVALKGIATQSSTYQGIYFAHFAIDGITESSSYISPCTHTNMDYNAWWRLDLLAVHDIKNVIITNRGEGTSERLNDAEIHIGNSLDNNGNNNPRCVVIASIPDGGTKNYTCNMRGRYVNVIIPKIAQFLSLCEVEVYGFPVPAIKMALLRLKFNSSEDLTNSDMRDKVLHKMKSANLPSSIFHLSWTKEPELEKET
ncbi:fucolectin-like [Neoarius graeffei]|uniref:fucolectin-like n=1 Tax=Neoarius graeffei TaxID=443677 RepID=UPI00298CCA55|nr:fucolectin-like [Neoarius graeffei]